VTAAGLGVDSVYADHRDRLQDERRFRLEQLADLQAKTPMSPRHESVTRLLCVSARVALTEVEAALARIEEGRYGLCTSCWERLSAERLAVLPSAALCTRCHYNEQNCRLAPTWSNGRG
jgi:DnaK suppressor protein